MSYLTLKEASEATGLNEATIRRLCKKSVSKPFIEMRKGKQGGMYTIQTNYLFDTYPPLDAHKSSAYTRVDNDSTSLDKKPIQAYTELLTAKDDIIQLLKSETAYLRAENTSLREENRELKLLSAPTSFASDLPELVDQQSHSFWKRLFGRQ